MKRFMKHIAVILIIAVTATGTSIPPVSTDKNNNIVNAKTNSENNHVKKKIYLNNSQKTLKVGKSISLKLKGAKKSKIKWKSLNKRVAKVSQKGKVTAIKKGKAVITAIYKKKKYQCKITVTTSNDTKTKELSQAVAMLDYFNAKKNIVVSPVSLNMVLGMIANGANDTSKKQIRKYLGSDIATYNNDALSYMKKANNSGVVKLANGIWYRDIYSINPAYQKLVKNQYQATVQSEPFDASTVREINNWADRNTDGMIKDVIDQIDKDATVILANALLFDGKWTSPMRDYSGKKKFTKSGGTKKKVDMMYSTEHIYYENDYAKGFEKAYGNNREYSFIAILPKQTGDFKLSDLDLESFIASSTNKYRVYVDVPKFSYEWNSSSRQVNRHTMDDYLKKAGMKKMYSAASNPLSDMLTNSQHAFIDEIKQVCKIEMNTDGTKAAAVTTSVAKTASTTVDDVKPKTVKLNRPFAYIIKDNKSNRILFMGKVLEP